MTPTDPYCWDQYGDPYKMHVVVLTLPPVLAYFLDNVLLLVRVITSYYCVYQ
jgi:hypothetical protein